MKNRTQRILQTRITTMILSLLTIFLVQIPTSCVQKDQQPTRPEDPNAPSLTDAWKNFRQYNEHPEWDTADRILQDYSWAGYDHGHTAPAETHPGWKIYDVTDYGAIPDDGHTDREAFLKTLQAAGVYQVEDGALNGRPIVNPQAKAIIYFPEGEYILHNYKDDIGDHSYPIEINAGHLILKGAGRDKTTIHMASPNLPAYPDVLYSSPEMLVFKTPSQIADPGISAQVTENASAGAFTVTLDHNPGLVPGDWTCLSLILYNPSEEVLRYELEGHAPETYMTALRECLEVRDYHQVKSIKANEITFFEPLMRGIDLKRDVDANGMTNWRLKRCNSFQQIGIEDLKFKGNAKADFVHHASWRDDGAYKPLQLTRVINSWLRRVDFESISECATFASSANSSAYDIRIYGNRGHSGVRSNGSTRIFLGKITETSKGRYIAQGQKPYGPYMENAGQYHASGVSKPSIGAVLWRNHWGDDATFEAHASQPRATLVDCCKGGWVEWRFGGATGQLPNHLRDLTLWNFEALRFYGRPEQQNAYQWWNIRGGEFWRVAPPIVVGFHGPGAVTFDWPGNTDVRQMKHFESYGRPVSQESLYEAQFRLRNGGALPSWLESLKAL